LHKFLRLDYSLLEVKLDNGFLIEDYQSMEGSKALEWSEAAINN
jgi:hypothetical protein